MVDAGRGTAVCYMVAKRFIHGVGRYTQYSWRIFDVLWRLHIMDYYEGDDINNVLLNIIRTSLNNAAYDVSSSESQKGPQRKILSINRAIQLFPLATEIELSHLLNKPSIG